MIEDEGLRVSRVGREENSDSGKTVVTDFPYVECTQSNGIIPIIASSFLRLRPIIDYLAYSKSSGETFVFVHIHPTTQCLTRSQTRFPSTWVHFSDTLGIG